MKKPEWTDTSAKQDGSSWLLQCDYFYITLIKSEYPSGFDFVCRQVDLDEVIRNTKADDAKLIALQRIDERMTTLIRSAKRLKLAEQAQAVIVFSK